MKWTARKMFFILNTCLVYIKVISLTKGNRDKSEFYHLLTLTPSPFHWWSTLFMEKVVKLFVEDIWVRYLDMYYFIIYVIQSELA